jgi:hypothetical protein
MRPMGDTHRRVDNNPVREEVTAYAFAVHSAPLSVKRRCRGSLQLHWSGDCSCLIRAACDPRCIRTMLLFETSPAWNNCNIDSTLLELVPLVDI